MRRCAWAEARPAALPRYRGDSSRGQLTTPHQLGPRPGFIGMRLSTSERTGEAVRAQHQFTTARVVALDRGSGEIRWERRIQGCPRDLKLTENRLLLIGEGGLHGLDVATGGTLWRTTECNHDGVTLSISIPDSGRVKVHAESFQETARGRIYSRRSCGEFSVSDGRRMEVTSAPRSIQVNGLSVSDDASTGRLKATDVRTDRLRWERTNLYSHAEPYSVAGDTLFFSEPRAILALALSSGSVVWRFPLPETPNSRPIPAGGALFFTTRDDHLWKLE